VIRGGDPVSIAFIHAFVARLRAIVHCHPKKAALSLARKGSTAKGRESRLAGRKLHLELGPQATRESGRRQILQRPTSLKNARVIRAPD
jgi:hypothetical protein